MKQLIFGLLAIFMTLSTGIAQEREESAVADCPPHHRREKVERFEMLDLTEEQREKIEDAEIEARKKIIPLKAEIEMKAIDLEKEMKADNPNRSKIMKLTEEISNLRLKIQQTRIDVRLKVHALFTPEQREQLRGHKMFGHRPMHKFFKKRMFKEIIED
ncbi:MAG: periplasmic heavy metal sensor [candidate division WOR-3 bacterium]|nr:MAG: periplasmic heavy metal sensor [candidate division WOR-3 bacterium]